MQGCCNSAMLQTPCTNCHNLVINLSQSYKVVARLLQCSYFYMGCINTFDLDTKKFIQMHPLVYILQIYLLSKFCKLVDALPFENFAMGKSLKLLSYIYIGITSTYDSRKSTRHIMT